MESSKPAPSNLGSLARTITKILRFRRPSTAGNGDAGAGFDISQDDEIQKLKPSKTIEEFPSILSESLTCSEGKATEEKQQEPACSNREASESLLATLFASISAVKASYAQLQVAQSPYDPETIQSADQAVVLELKHLSELKQSYFRQQVDPHCPLPTYLQQPAPPLASQIHEHRNLLKTFQITTRKLESDLQLRDAEILSLQGKLMEIDRQNRYLDSRLHPGRSLSSLDDFHLSGLDPTHFLAVLRFTVKSVRSFVKLMVHEMESAGWDLDAAAGSIQRDVHWKLGRRNFAFESFVCQRMFSDFQHRDFSLSSLEERASWNREQFFTEFTELKSVELKQFLNRRGGSSGLGKFCRAKYLGLVHPKMEASFFGDLDQRALVSSGRGFPDSEFFAGFAEMAKRVWLLQCLFFSFEPEMEGSIFQVRKGCRFSEVYMESVAEDQVLDAQGVRPTVEFTVVPGFRLGKMVIQSKVYLSVGRS